MPSQVKKNGRLRTDNFRFINTSEAVQSIDYSRRMKILEVEFISREVYHYLSVQPGTWREIERIIESGDSLGTYLNKVVKQEHEYYKLTE